jgi:hypothetical protein
MGLGSVRRQVVDPEQGRFSATVDIRRRSMLMLKASFDPRWRVTVDGVEVDPQMIAPSFVGREIGPGRHVVTFQYVPYGAYWLMFLISIATVVGLWLLDRRRRTAIAHAALEPPFRERVRKRKPKHVVVEEPVAEPGWDSRSEEEEPDDQPPASTAAPTAPE